MAPLGTRVKHLGRILLNRLATRMSSAFGWVTVLYASHRRSTEVRQQRLSTDPARLDQDLVAQESAVNTAAARVRGTWVTYLVLWTYLVIAVGSITHRQLFLAEGIKLPVLDVDLPLIGFFWVAPGLFIVMHLYLLLQLRGLLERVSTYETILCHGTKSPAERARRRQRLDPYIVLQAVAGSEEGLHDRIYVGVLRFIVWLTVVFAPLGLLFFVQVRFLPYHDEAATWAHRVFIALDLLCLWLIWRPALVANTANTLVSIVRSGLALAGSLAGVFLSVLVLIFPGEAVEAYQASILSRPVVGTWAQNDRLTSDGWILNHIVLSVDDDFIDDDEIAKLDAREKERPTNTFSSGAMVRSFRDRDFRGAVLDSLDLRRTNFANAQLQGASLDRAQLQGASLDRAQLQGASLANAFSWRTVPGSAPDLESAYITDLEAAPVIGSGRLLNFDLIPLEPERLSGLVETWSKDIPEGDRTDFFLKRLQVLEMDARTPEEDGATIDAWVRLEKDSLSFEDWLPIHLKILVATACNAGVDGYVSSGIARGLRDRFDFSNPSAPDANALAAEAAKTLLDATPDSCPGAVAIDDAARAALQAIITEAAKQWPDAEAQRPATSDGAP